MVGGAATKRAAHSSRTVPERHDRSTLQLISAGSRRMARARSSLRSRSDAFCARFGLRVPILLAPMAGASAPELSIAVANAGGLGACGALPMQPHEILAWAATVRGASNGRFQLNLWIPDPPPRRDGDHEARVRDYIAGWGPPVPAEAGDAKTPDFAAQCEALLEASPPIVSSV